MLSVSIPKHQIWIRPTLLAAAWAASYGGAHLVLNKLGFEEREYSKLIVNIIFLITCIVCLRLFRLSAGDVGLKISRHRLVLHVGLGLAIFTMYCLYYLFGVKISSLRPLTAGTMLGLLNYLVVAFAEEIYFRGIWYQVVEERTSGPISILVTGLLFGLVHFRQGLGMLPKFFTGWLWGSVRYATGMVFLLIPIHFTYNAVWLTFQGSWENPSNLALLFPLVELMAAILIVIYSKFRRGLNSKDSNVPSVVKNVISDF